MSGSRPLVEIEISNDNVGALLPGEDGTTLIFATGVAQGSYTLGDVAGPYISIAQVEAAGFDEAYDTANSCLVWHHARDFFNVNNGSVGQKLYLCVVADTTTLDAMTDKDGTVASKIKTLSGEVKQVVFTRVPDGLYAPTYTDGVENDILTAITNIGNLVTEEQAAQRPIRCILEARNLQTPISSLKDMTAVAGPDNNAVMLVGWQDKTVADKDAAYAKYAAAGYVAGKKAGEGVQRSVARVRSGAIDKAIVPQLSSETDIATMDPADVDTLLSRGYNVVMKHIRKAGFYIGREWTCSPATDDFHRYSDGMTIDKVNRIAIDVWTDELEDDIFLNEDGTMSPAYIKDFQGRLEDAVEANMVGEISGVTAFADPSQNVASTGQITAEIDVFKKGKAGSVKATLGFKVNTES